MGTVLMALADIGRFDLCSPDKRTLLAFTAPDTLIYFPAAVGVFLELPLLASHMEKRPETFHGSSRSLVPYWDS